MRPSRRSIVSPVTQRARYTLTTAMLIVRQTETSATRTAVFDEIKLKNRVVRIADRIYAGAGAWLLRRLILVLYMLKCVLSLDPRSLHGARAVAVANFANEVHAIGRIAALIPEVKIVTLTPARRHVFTRGQFCALWRVVRVLPRCWPLLGQLARGYSFMPACRMSSALVHYIRFGHLMDAGPAQMFAIAASNYSPEAVGLMAAAHARNRKTIYINHAHVPRNSPYVPPVLADVSVFHGAAVQETYSRRSRCLTTAVLIGQSGSATPLAWRDQCRTVGIFLTALTRLELIERLVSQINVADARTRILIRQHPVALLETDLSQLCMLYSDIRVTLGTPLAENIAECDAVICGNSGVILNVLRGGRPAAYFPELDALPLDYNGFLESGLVPCMKDWDAQTYDALRAFYGVPGWDAVMSDYDASYRGAVKELEQVARVQLLERIRL